VERHSLIVYCMLRYFFVGCMTNEAQISQA
jgi:hypothetical protein